MRYLLDVNALLALLLAEHVHYPRTLSWVQTLVREKRRPELLTCPITELGFVRIVSQLGVYHRTVAEAKWLLDRAKGGTVVRFSFREADLPASRLPEWVLRSGQVTDGYLLELAQKNDCQLAALDEKIPGAFLIPR